MTPNVTCVIQTDRVSILNRKGEEIGFVSDARGTAEPKLFLYNSPIETPNLTFTDIAVIQDNWNQMVEMKRQKEIRNPLDRFRFCDEKHP